MVFLLRVSPVDPATFCGRRADRVGGTPEESPAALISASAPHQHGLTSGRRLWSNVGFKTPRSPSRPGRCTVIWRVANGRLEMRRSTRRTRLWQRWGILVAVSAVVVFALVLIIQRDKGFAFTPRWSAVFAAWALLTLTVVVDAVVRWQGDRDVDAAVVDAKAQADAARRFAAEAADRARKAGADPIGDPQVRAAGNLAVGAAIEYTSALVRARRAGLKNLVVGADGRASTSKIQAVLWTYAVLFALLYMVVLGRTLFAGVPGEAAPGVGGFGNAFADFLAAGFRFEYVALLGLPIAGAVAAKGITTGKVVSEEVLKAPAGAKPGVGRGLAEAVSNDSGQTDLVDFQYFAFSLVALLYYFITFATTSAVEPARGLPVIPATLLALSGVSTTAYLFKKQLESGLAPVISSVAPMRVVVGVDREIQITGDGFLAEGRRANSAFNQVLVDGRPLQTRKWTATSVTALLPSAVDRETLVELGWRDKADAVLVVRDDRGNSSPLVKIEVVLPKEAPPPDEATAGTAPAAPPASATPAPGAPASPASQVDEMSASELAVDEVPADDSTVKLS
jgi:hypothetical protein